MSCDPSPPASILTSDLGLSSHSCLPPHTVWVPVTSQQAWARRDVSDSSFSFQLHLKLARTEFPQWGSNPGQ